MEAAEPKETKRGSWKKFYNFLATGFFTCPSSYPWNRCHY
jgi:hypothetical protein